MTEYSETPAISKNSKITNLLRAKQFIFQVGTDHLWLLAIFACCLFLTSLMPLNPNDFWWHLKIGEIIYSQRTIPSTNIFAWSIPGDQPFTYAAWLAEYLFFLIYRIGKLELILFTRTLLTAILLGLLAYEAQRRSGSWRIAALAIVLAWLMIFNNLNIRPQIWSWMPFVAYFLILSRYVEGQLSKRWLWMLPFLMIFWVNVHGVFILGIALIGVYLVGETLTTLLRGPTAISWDNIRWLGIIGLMTLMAMLFNPQTYHIFGYVLDLMTDLPIQELVEEWHSPTPEGLSNIAFFLSILFLLAGLAYSHYRPRISEIILLAGLLWLAWSGQRNIFWYALVVTPILAAIFAGLQFRLPRLRSSKKRINLIIAAVLILPSLLVQPWFVEKIPLQKIYGDSVMHDSQIGPLLSRSTPVKAAEYLLANPGDRLFNEMGYGSYLIWAMPPGNVFIDPRIELYPYEQWQDYIYISHGLRYNQLLEQYGARRVLLDKEIQPELAEALASDPAWGKEYEDQRAQIWRKK